MSTKTLALLVAILGLSALPGCGEEPQTQGESQTQREPRTQGESAATSEPSASGEGATTTPSRTEEGAAPRDAGGETLELEVGGSPGTEFSGTCAVGGGEPEELGGRTPQSFTYDLRGKPLECEISSEGALEVTLTRANNRSVQRFDGGTVNLTYDNGSISSSSSSNSSRVTSSGGADGGSAGATNGSAGNVASEPRDVSGFDEVELSGIGSLSIRQTGTESLTVKAEEEILPKIGTEVVDGRLLIGPEPNTSIETTEPIDYELTVDNLRALELSGSGDIRAEGIDTDVLAATVGGSGDVRISGRTESQRVNVSGSGSYEAEGFESTEATVDVEGAGSAIVNARNALDATVGGAGSVEYVGDPTVEQDVSGAGRVRKR